MLKFPEMPYERPDVEAAKQFLADAAARLDAAESFEAADAVFVEVDKYTTDLNTMFTIAHIRHDINTADEFYDAEVEYADTALPELQEYVDRWNRSLVSTRWRPQLAEKYSSIVFLNKEIDMRHLLPRDQCPSCRRRTRCAPSTPSFSPPPRSSSTAACTRSPR